MSRTPLPKGQLQLFYVYTQGDASTIQVVPLVYLQIWRLAVTTTVPNTYQLVYNWFVRLAAQNLNPNTDALLTVSHI